MSEPFELTPSPSGKPARKARPNRRLEEAQEALASLHEMVGRLQSTLETGPNALLQTMESEILDLESKLRQLVRGSGQKPARGVELLLEDLQRVHDELPSAAAKLPETSRDRKLLDAKFARLRAHLERDAWLIDRVRRPDGIFDPTDPNLVGRMIALALTAQPPMSFSAIEGDRFYGAGVYALYYKGDLPEYARLKDLPHPIYVGKADPASPSSVNVVEQGERLFSRLRDHARSIRQARNLELSDFEVRYLVVAGNWQRAAEIFLIRLMNPIWNLEAKILFGFGKHGDSAETRANGRSPWDTLHPGRKFAEEIVEDQIPLDVIKSSITSHFDKHRIYTNADAIFEEFMSQMGQLPKILQDDLATAESADDKAEREGHPGEPGEAIAN